MEEREKRTINLWLNNTIENLEDTIENENLTPKEVEAIKTTILVLKRQIKN